MKSMVHSRPKKYRAGIADSVSSEDALWFGTASDLAVFAQLLLNHGFYNHRRFFKNETILRMIGSKGYWSMPSKTDWTGDLFVRSAFGHNASNGSMFWIDPSKKMFFVLLTNSPDLSPKSKKIDEIQRMLGESILEQIEKQ
jgi:serine-type D-Ala-D-Ala carboxypeptidase